MLFQRCILGLSILSFALTVVTLTDNDQASAQDKKKEKDPQEGKKGKVIGILTDRGPDPARKVAAAFIEVKADGEEKARRYVPHWVGGNPDKGGGPDKKVVKVITELKVGSRVEVEWEFEERLRILTVKVLKAPPEKDKK